MTLSRVISRALSDWFIEFRACILKSPETNGKENRGEEDGCIGTCIAEPRKAQVKGQE